jgi:hypothetical protein
VSLLKSCSSSKDLSAYKILWSHVDWCKFFIHFSSLKIPPSPYAKGLLRKIFIQIRLVDMFTIFQCIKLCLSKCKSSWVVAVKQNVNVKYQPPAMFVSFLFCTKKVFLKVLCPLKIYQNTEFYGPMLSGISFSFTSEVWMSTILEWLQLQH